MFKTIIPTNAVKISTLNSPILLRKSARNFSTDSNPSAEIASGIIKTAHIVIRNDVISESVPK
jgi:hypothetical protein